MATAKMTIVGAEQHLNRQDSSLFANASFPTGIEKALVTDAVIMRGGEFEVLYSDIDFMQSACTLWARRWYHTFEKWINAINIEYEPLYNYDRTEEWTTTDDGSDLTTRALQDQETRNLQDLETRNLQDLETRNLQDLETRNLQNQESRDLETTGSRSLTSDVDASGANSGTGTSTDTVSAYNSNVFENDKKNDTTTSGTTSSTSETVEKEETSGTDSGTVTKTDTGTVTRRDSGTVNRSDSGTVTRKDSGTVTRADTGTVSVERENTNTRHGRAYGNIGVTTSQQMLQSELEIAVWNLYNHIADIFLEEFAIPVY